MKILINLSLLFIVLAALSPCDCAAEAVEMAIRFTDGSAARIAVSDGTAMHIDGFSLTIGAGNDAVYSLGDISSFSYISSQQSGTASVISDSVKLTLEGQCIVVSGADKPLDCVITDMSGRSVLTAPECGKVDVAQLTQGVYVVSLLDGGNVVANLKLVRL